MFTTLEIKNFKSIGHALLDLGKINVITGHSNLGKSNVVQAIYCLTHNHWDSNYLKWGEKSCSVRLTDDTGAWVEYRHGKDTAAEYSLSSISTPFTKIGRDVPDAVKQFLNMNQVQFDEDLMLDFNFERQFDPPFILSLSGFELAKVFGKMMNLDIVLSAARNINKDLSALNKQIDAQKAIEQVSINYIQSHYAIELKYALLHTAQQMDEKAELLDQKNNQLLQYLTDLKMYQEKISVYKSFLDSPECQAIDQMEEPIVGLDNIITSVLWSNQAQTVYANVLSDAIPNFDFGANNKLFDAIVDINLAHKKQVTYGGFLKQSECSSELVENLTNLVSLIGNCKTENALVGSLEVELLKCRQDVVSKSNEFSCALKENNICPISGRPFAEGCVESIVETV